MIKSNSAEDTFSFKLFGKISGRFLKKNLEWGVKKSRSGYRLGFIAVYHGLFMLTLILLEKISWLNKSRISL